MLTLLKTRHKVINQKQMSLIWFCFTFLSFYVNLFWCEEKRTIKEERKLTDIEMQERRNSRGLDHLCRSCWTSDWGSWNPFTLTFFTSSIDAVLGSESSVTKAGLAFPRSSQSMVWMLTLSIAGGVNNWGVYSHNTNSGNHKLRSETLKVLLWSPKNFNPS